MATPTLPLLPGIWLEHLVVDGARYIQAESTLVALQVMYHEWALADLLLSTFTTVWLLSGAFKARGLGRRPGAWGLLRRLPALLAAQGAAVAAHGFLHLYASALTPHVPGAPADRVRDANAMDLWHLAVFVLSAVAEARCCASAAATAALAATHWAAIRSLGAELEEHNRRTRDEVLSLRLALQSCRQELEALSRSSWPQPAAPGRGAEAQEIADAKCKPDQA